MDLQAILCDELVKSTRKMCDVHHKTIDLCDGCHIMSTIKSKTCKKKKLEHTMKMRKILKSMFEQYCKTFKDVPPAGMF